MISLWTFWRRVVLAVAACCALWGIVSFVYYWDPTRVIIKRTVAKSPYRYEEILPQFLKYDPQKAITIRTAQEAEARRKALAGTIWGMPKPPSGYSLEAPIPIDMDSPKPDDCPATAIAIRYSASLHCETGRYRGIENLAEINHREFSTPSGFRSAFAEFRPHDWNAWIVLYHHGYAGTYHDQHYNIERLIELGYAVLAFNLPGYGDNRMPPGSGLTAARRIISPIMLALNDTTAHVKSEGIAMIGFSAGGWATAMAAALAPRIRASYTVASPIYPVALGDPKLEAPDIARVQELLDSAEYLDLFMLGTSSSGNEPRRQLQIFNRFDRCCWRNRTALLYAGTVSRAVSSLGGDFEVRIDESHARHKISRQAMDWILADLERIRQ